MNNGNDDDRNSLMARYNAPVPRPTYQEVWQKLCVEFEKRHLKALGRNHPRGTDPIPDPHFLYMAVNISGTAFFFLEFKDPLYPKDINESHAHLIMGTSVVVALDPRKSLDEQVQIGTFNPETEMNWAYLKAKPVDGIHNDEPQILSGYEKVSTVSSAPNRLRSPKRGVLELVVNNG